MFVRLLLCSVIVLSLLSCVVAEQQPTAAVRSELAPDQVLSVDQLSAIHFGTESAGKWLPYRVTLAPAQWIWLPSERTLPNTFVLFRKEFSLAAQPTRAIGWLTADSRYRLTVNGQRVQWGPAPAIRDNWTSIHWTSRRCCNRARMSWRWKSSITGSVKAHGRPAKPGLLFHALVETPQGEPLRIVSDGSWQCTVDRAHRPAQPKRWFLRALQEEFDARQHPQGWARANLRRTSAGSLRCCSHVRRTSRPHAVVTPRPIRSTRHQP